MQLVVSPELEKRLLTEKVHGPRNRHPLKTVGSFAQAADLALMLKTSGERLGRELAYSAPDKGHRDRKEYDAKVEAAAQVVRDAADLLREAAEFYGATLPS